MPVKRTKKNISKSKPKGLNPNIFKLGKDGFSTSKATAYGKGSLGHQFMQAQKGKKKGKKK